MPVKSINKKEGLNVFYKGSKTDWRTRSTLELIFVDHEGKNCIEVLCFNSKIGQESTRIYLKKEDVVSGLSTEAIEDNLKSKKEVFLRKKLNVDTPALRIEVVYSMITQYILSRLFAMPGEPFQIDLSIQMNDKLQKIKIEDGSEEDILSTRYPDKPNGLEGIEVHFVKVASSDEIKGAMKLLRQETKRLVISTNQADLAANSIEKMKSIVSDRYTTQLRLKRTYSQARLRWVNAIERVLTQNYIEKVTKRLAMIEAKEELKNKEKEMRSYKLSSEVGIDMPLIDCNHRAPRPVSGKKSRSTLDNSVLTSIANSTADLESNKRRERIGEIRGCFYLNTPEELVPKRKNKVAYHTRSVDQLPPINVTDKNSTRRRLRDNVRNWEVESVMKPRTVEHPNKGIYCNMASIAEILSPMNLEPSGSVRTNYRMQVFTSTSLNTNPASTRS